MRDEERCKEAESLPGFLERTKRALEQLCTACHEEGGRTVVVVAHSAVLSAFLCHCLELPDLEASLSLFRTDGGSVTVVGLLPSSVSLARFIECKVWSLAMPAVKGPGYNIARRSFARAVCLHSFEALHRMLRHIFVVAVPSSLHLGCCAGHKCAMSTICLPAGGFPGQWTAYLRHRALRELHSTPGALGHSYHA